jgi:hypothetical protein
MTVDPSDGLITALTNTGSGTVQATLPAELGFAGPAPTGQVLFADGWAMQRTAKPVSGTASTTPKADGLNLLLLPDGFLPDEQGKFEVYARNLVKKWKDTPAVAPFGIMPINVFSVWIPSVEKGTTVRNLLRYTDGTPAKQKADAMPFPVAPAPGQTPQTIAELLYVVGLPTIPEAATLLATKQAEWTALYGAAIANVSAALYQQWTQLSDYVIAAERNTAFGAASGDPAQVTFPDDGRSLAWHERRAERSDVDKMLAALVDNTGASVGTTWTAPLPAIGRLTVAVLASGGRYAGARTESTDLGGPGEMIFSSLNNDHDILLADVVGRHIPDLRSYNITSHLPLTTISRVTHELGHALTLGDEYGGSPRAEGSRRVRARTTFPNLQDEADVTDANGIEGSLILWQSWPRISAAGLVVAPITGVNPNYDVTVRSGHGALFVATTPTIPGDTVRLRQRPFYGKVGTPPDEHLQYLPESIDFTVQSITPGPAGDVIRIVRSGTGTFTPGTYTANNAILFASQGTLKMVHAAVSQEITTRHLPLNRVVTTPAPACTVDDSVRQTIPSGIGALKPGIPKLRAWIVGLCDGGASFHCGIFHPRGSCMMRALQVRHDSNPATKKKRGFLYDFCPVCRYIIIDKIDPSLHGKMDQLYDKIYPVAL